MKNWRARRSIDWRVTMAHNPPQVRLIEPTTQLQEFAAISSALLADPSFATVRSVLRRTVEFVRSGIRFERAAIFLLDEEHQAMVGTWGTDATGNTVDEHGIMYDYGALDREVFARAEQGFPWTVYEDCPHIAQENGETRILGRGWAGCTPIIGPDGPIGTLFNDAALSHRSVDESQQARAAVLCSLLGRALHPCRAFLFEDAPVVATVHPLVREATRCLVADPTLSCSALAKRLGVSATTLTRTFKREARVSVVDHRNELRLARFLGHVDAEGGNLVEAALYAGFGSYAQFHRVFRARFGMAPRDYLLDRRLGTRRGR